jgi:hypothetical protein
MPLSQQLVRLWHVLRVVCFSAAALGTVIALFYAEENWRGRRAWQAHLAEMAAKGESFDWDIRPSPAIPDDRNFVKTPLLEALAYNQKFGREHLAKISSLGIIAGQGLAWRKGQTMDLAMVLADLRGRRAAKEPTVKASPAAEILTIMQPLQVDLQELREAARTRPQGQFRTMMTAANGYSGPELDPLFDLSRILGVYILAELAENRVELAFEDTLVLQRLAAAIGSDSTLLSIMVAQAIHSGSTGQIFWEGWQMARWSPAQYTAFQSAFATVSPADVNRALRSERSFMNRAFSQSSLSDIRTLFVKSNDRSLQSWGLALMPRGWWLQNLICHNQAMQGGLANGFDESPPRYRSEPVDHWGKQLQQARSSHNPFHWLTALTGTNLEKLATHVAAEHTPVQLAVIVCALERYRAERGEYPERLDALVPQFIATLPVDLYTGQSFLYRRTVEKEFLLYSAGPNEKDDGGQPETDDIVWPARTRR